MMIQATIERAVHALPIAVVVLAASTATAGAQACRTTITDEAEGIMASVKNLAASTDAQAVYDRADFKIPATDSSTVVLVSNNTTCQKALAAHLSAFPAGAPTPTPTNAYVVKVGTVYVVTTPVAGQDRQSYSVISSKYAVLSIYAH